MGRFVRRIPSCLRSEMYYNLIGERVLSVPVFKDCEIPFVRLLCTRARIIHFYRHEYIYRKGDIAKDLFFIQKGQVELCTNKRITITGSADFFGDDSILKQNYPRNSSAQAITHVDVFAIGINDIEDAYRYFPDQAILVKAAIKDVEENELGY